MNLEDVVFEQTSLFYDNSPGYQTRHPSFSEAPSFGNHAGDPFIVLDAFSLFLQIPFEPPCFIFHLLPPRYLRSELFIQFFTRLLYPR